MQCCKDSVKPCNTLRNMKPHALPLLPILATSPSPPGRSWGGHDWTGGERLAARLFTAVVKMMSSCILDSTQNLLCTGFSNTTNCDFCMLFLGQCVCNLYSWQCVERLADTHLLLVVTMTPFSVEKASEGSPWMFQSLTTVGLARNVAKEKSGEQGMLSPRT